MNGWKPRPGGPAGAVGPFPLSRCAPTGPADRFPDAGAARFTGDGLRPHPVPLTAAEFRHQEAAAVAAEDATAWDRDHQLQLVRAVLRGPRPDLRIGFFPHLPFPPVGRPGRHRRTARARAVLPAVPTAPQAMDVAAVTR
ncbi:hypothetical protein OZK63_18505 [Streptomyces sp. UMAF16]|nr:hypothetical protein [Streptomyces sp. UMAF16]